MNGGRSLVARIAVGAILCISCQATGPGSQVTGSGNTPETASVLPLAGLAYGPYHLGQNPDYDVYPSAAEIAADFPTLASLTSSIRIYSSLGPAPYIVQDAERAHMSVNLGISLGRNAAANRREMAAGISLMSNPAVSTVTVGSEVLLRGDLSEPQLCAAIKTVQVAARKASHPVLVTTADTDTVWLAHPELARCVGTLTVHFYPFWQKVPIGDAMQVLNESYDKITQAFPGRKIIIGETGWPSAGPPQGAAVPSAANEARYFTEFIAWAKQQRNLLQYYYFDAFDEAWKTDEQGAGTHWGLYNQDGSLKPAFNGLLPAASPVTLSERAYRDIFVDALSVGFGLGINTSGNRYGWLTAEQGILTLAYPPGRRGERCSSPSASRFRQDTGQRST